MLGKTPRDSIDIGMDIVAEWVMNSRLIDK